MESVRLRRIPATVASIVGVQEEKSVMKQKTYALRKTRQLQKKELLSYRLQL